MNRAPAPIDVDRLGALLDAHLGGHEPVTVAPMRGGGSCEIFSVTRADREFVLRRAPAHASSTTAHDMLREYRILDAIKDTAVRVPRPVAAGAEPAIAGTPFYVMSRVDGVPVRGSIPTAWVASPETQNRAFEELIDALVEIHAVEWRAVGLDGIGNPSGYLDRQVGRWLSQLESYGERRLVGVGDLAAWLDQHRPHEQPPTLVHGDYKLDNVLFSPAAPPDLLAVVDWEMATIGDPLVDLAWAMIFHPGPGATMALGMTGPDTFTLDRVPPAADLIDRYAARSRRDLGDLAWYHVFARWKLAIVLEGTYAKHLRGDSDNPSHAFFGSAADRALASGLELAGIDAPVQS
jgi:aminoglycoside phosphotransferase (APT) family kinase protein